jgi:hypothetical protein
MIRLPINEAAAPTAVVAIFLPIPVGRALDAVRERGESQSDVIVRYVEAHR